MDGIGRMFGIFVAANQAYFKMSDQAINDRNQIEHSLSDFSSPTLT